MKLYILVDREPVLEPDIEKWGHWFKTADRVFRKDRFGNVEVSTVFLGLDHAFGGEPPMLFETMVFGGPLDEEMERCSTWEAAEKMHERMVERVKLTTKELK